MDISAPQDVNNLVKVHACTFPPPTVLGAEHTRPMQPHVPKLIPKCAPVFLLFFQPGFHACQ